MRRNRGKKTSIPVLENYAYETALKTGTGFTSAISSRLNPLLGVIFFFFSGRCIFLFQKRT